MSGRTPALLLMLTLACPSVALDPSAWSGLKVAAEALPDETQINGLPVRVIRFTGRDVMEIERRWLAMRHSSQVRSLSHDVWRIHAVLGPTSSEVLQVRPADKPELIWSSLALSEYQASPQRGTSLLPADCQQGRSVAVPRGAERFLQYSALCRRSVDALIPILEARLKRGGFQVLKDSSQGVEAASAKVHISIVFLPSSGASHGTTVSVLERELPQGRQ